MTLPWSYRAIVVFLLGAVLTGCATHDGNGHASASIPTRDWRPTGVWYGSTFEIGPASPHYGSTLTYRFEDDGRWTATETLNGGRVVEYTGTSEASRTGIILRESNGRRFVSLTRSGNRLYGMENMRSMAGSRIMIELTRSE